MDFEEQKRGLVFAMTNVLRTSRLVDALNVQEAAAAFGMLLDQAKPGQPIDLTPFWEFLTVKKQCPEDAVAEALLFFKSRESRFNASFALPPKLQGMDESARNRIISDFITRGATSGTFVGTKAVDASQKAQAEVHKERAASSGSVVTKKPQAARAASLPHKGLLVALGVLVAAGLGISSYMASTAPPKAMPITIHDAGTLPCDETKANQGWVICRMSVEKFKAIPKAELKKMGEATKQAAARQGHTAGVHLVTLEDAALRLTF